MMSGQNKEEMMSKMMENFFGSMSQEDKQQMMENMMSKMMSGSDMISMMPKMMMNMMGESNCIDKMSNMPMMPEMAQEMMPKCLKMVLPKIEQEKREKFIMTMMEILLNNETGELTEENKAKIKDMLSSI